MLAPDDGTGTGDLDYLKSDKITKVEGGGVDTCETGPITNVDGDPPMKWSQIDTVGKSGQTMTYSNDDKTINNDSTNQCVCRTTASVSDGKYYFEYKINKLTGGVDIAFMDATVALSDTGDLYLQLGRDGIRVTNNGMVYMFTETGSENLLLKYKLNDIVRFTLDTAAGKVQIAVNDGDFQEYTHVRLQNMEAKPAVYIRSGGTVTGFFDTETNYPIPPGFNALSGEKVLSFADNTGFNCFEPGDVVQDPDVKVISKDPDVTPPTITVDGGNWSTVDAQTWSNDLSNSNLQTAEASFDGDLNTGAGTSNTSSDQMVYTIPVELQSKDLVVYVAGGNTTPSQGQIEFDSNGVNAISTGTAFTTTIDPSNLNGFYLEVPSELHKWHSTTFATRGCHFLGLEASGTLLIDNQTNGDRKCWSKTRNDHTTVEGDTDLAEMAEVLGGCLMTDGSTTPDGSGGNRYVQSGYKLTTPQIENVDWGNDPGIVLTFDGDLSANTDLQYFRAGDIVGGGTMWSELWEETAPGANINNPGQGFDGDLATVGSGSSTTKIDLSDYGFANKTVEWYNNNGSTQGANLNDEADPTGTGNSSIGWYTLGTVPADGRCEITLNGHGTSSYIAALRIDGNILIDGTPAEVITTGILDGTDTNTMKVSGGKWKGTDGSTSGDAGWDQQARWRNMLEVVGGSFAGSASRAFDGDMNTNASSSGNKTIRFTSTVAFPSGVTLEVRCNKGTGGNHTISVNGAPGVSYPGTLGFAKIDYPAGAEAAFVIDVINDNTGAGTDLTGIRIGGKLLVDDDIAGPGPTPDLGDDKVEYQTNGGVGDLVSIDVAAKQLKIADSTGTTRDNRWIADNKADTAFYVAGPSKLDEPLLTSEVYLKSSDFSTTPETNPDGNPIDALKTITWSITPDNGAEMIQVAGQSGTENPYQPTGLTLNEWHTVKVKHEGLLLGESLGPWSDSIRFKTGASRNLREHYTTQIEEMRSELEELKAKQKRGRKKAD